VITSGGRLVGGLLTGGEVPDVKAAAEMFHVKLPSHYVHYISDCFYGLSIDKHVFIDNSESPETDLWVLFNTFNNRTSDTAGGQNVAYV
jgi:hypothetical protein